MRLSLLILIIKDVFIIKNNQDNMDHDYKHKP